MGKYITKDTVATSSNYTIKKKHKMLPNNTIYERDYMTTTNNGGWDSGSIPFGEGNFKIIHNDEQNRKRKHKYGNWLINDNCEISGETSGNTSGYTPCDVPSQCEFFTLKDVNSVDETTSETKIKLKANKSNFLDYVYYGNCVELIKASVDDIIVKYPAEIYVTSEPIKYYNSYDELKYLGGENYVQVKNPFNIDIVSLVVSNVDKNNIYYNELRYFAESSNQYNIIDGSGNTYPIVSWEVDNRGKDCPIDGEILATITLNKGYESEIVIRQYSYSKEKILMADSKYAGIRICPNNDIIDNFFNKIDDFEQFLLNRESSPKYTIYIDVPKENDYGTYLVNEKLTWPTDGVWNIDIESNSFASYYENLLEVAKWYDENRVDNLWRRMTHDSIKNMDRTHIDLSTDEDNDDYQIGTSKLHGLFYAYGRQFDDLKRLIENINTINTVTYNGNNNVPDYFLTDKLNLLGWEVKSVVETLNKDTLTDVLYKGNDKRYNLSDTNILFDNLLILNSKAIISRKGTREGIEMVLALFGFCSYDWAKKNYDAQCETLKTKRGKKSVSWDKLSEDKRSKLYDYTLNEYVAVASNNQSDVVDIDEELPVELYNSYKTTFGYSEDANPSEETLMGLPVRMVTVAKIENDEPVYQKYIIPWFSKYDDLDGNPYFQMFGGWDKTIRRDVLPNKCLYPSVNEITSIQGFSIYNETLKYLNVVNSIFDLKKIPYGDLTNGDVYYVNDISDFNNYYGSDINNATNYFIINDKEYCTVYGNDESGNTGWYNVTKEVLSCKDNPSVDAYKVIYLESLIDDNKGNNQHVGYGKYDGGNEYINYFRQIFKGAIDNNLFGDDAYNCETGELESAITASGFDIKDDVIDNVKTWYFSDTSNDNKMYRLRKVNSVVYDEDLDEYNIPTKYELVKNENKINVGEKAYTSKEVGFKSELKPFNLETQVVGSNDEAAANSIINIKKIKLTFNDKYADVDGFNDYIYKCVMPYVNQVVQSTAIMETFVPQKYTIRFVNWDGTLLYEKDEMYGKTVTYSGDTPTRDFNEDVPCWYKFIGWKPYIEPSCTEIDSAETKCEYTTTVYGNMTYVAQYEEIPAYKVNFVNWDYTLLQSSYTEYGVIVDYTGSTPTKPMEEHVRYKFNGWEPEVSEIIKDTTYVAQYIETEDLLIQFIDYNNSILQTTYVEVGEIPLYTGEEPTGYSSDWAFIGWDSEIIPATEDKTYKAKYEIPVEFNWLEEHKRVRYISDGIVLDEKYYNDNEALIPYVGTPTKQSYSGKTFTFTEWLPTEETTVTRNVDYIAQYSENNNIVVTFDTNSGRTNSWTENHNYGDLLTLPSIIPPELLIEGNELYLTGWKSDLYNQNWHFDYDIVKDNMVLTAQWDGVKCTVTFVDGENIITETPFKGGKVEKPSDPQKEGFNFKYWTLNDEEFNFDTPITQDITLVATYDIDTDDCYAIVYETINGDAMYQLLNDGLHEVGTGNKVVFINEENNEEVEVIPFAHINSGKWYILFHNNGKTITKIGKIASNSN